MSQGPPSPWATRAIALFLWLSCCSYPVLLVASATRDWGAYVQGFGAVPWKEPMVLALLIAAGLSFGLALLGRGLLLRQARRARTDAARLLLELLGMILGMALLEAVGIYGLVLGFALKPVPAPLCGLLMAVPILLLPFLLPPHARFGSTSA